MRSIPRALLALPTCLLCLAVLVPPASASGPPAGAAPVAAGDDYLWRTDTSQGADDWGFTKRQCVSFVAWRMAQRDHPLDNATERWGSALDWNEAAERLGYEVGSTPVAGSVAHWDAEESSPYYTAGATRPNARMTAGEAGHVGYVQGVYPDGSVSLAHYNMGGARSFSVIRVKAPRYLYISVEEPPAG